MVDGEINGVCDEAFGVCGVVKFVCGSYVGTGREGDLGTKDDADELPGATGGFLHFPFGAVEIRGDNDARTRAQVQIPELMAGG